MTKDKGILLQPTGSHGSDPFVHQDTNFSALPQQPSHAKMMVIYRVEDDQGNNVVLSNTSSLFEHLQDVLFYSAPDDSITIYIEEIAQ